MVFNDCCYTRVKESQATDFGHRFIGVDLENPDFIKLAEAYGIRGIHCDTPESLESAVRAAAQKTPPTIIEVPIEFPV